MEDSITTTPKDSTISTQENPTTSTQDNSTTSTLPPTSSYEDGWTQVRKRGKHVDPTTWKRTTPTIRSFFPSTHVQKETNVEKFPPKVCECRDRSTTCDLYLTNSGNLAYTEVVVRGTIPNPPFMSPDGDDADYISQEIFTSPNEIYR